MLAGLGERLIRVGGKADQGWGIVYEQTEIVNSNYIIIGNKYIVFVFTFRQRPK